MYIAVLFISCVGYIYIGGVQRDCCDDPSSYYWDWIKDQRFLARADLGTQTEGCGSNAYVPLTFVCLRTLTPPSVRQEDPTARGFFCLII